MQFVPDTRNVGGKYLILSQVHNHRISLQQIKDRPVNFSHESASYRSPYKNQNRSNSSRKKAVEDGNLKLKKKILGIHQAPGCLTERQNCNPSFFFRRVPSPKLKASAAAYASLLINKPLSYARSKKFKTKSTLNLLEKYHSEKSTNNYNSKKSDSKNLHLIPKVSKTANIEWNKVINDLQEFNGTQTMKQFITELAVKFQIYQESDFAILIRLCLQIFPDIKQQMMVEMVAKIIEELEK